MRLIFLQLYLFDSQQDLFVITGSPLVQLRNISIIPMRSKQDICSVLYIIYSIYKSYLYEVMLEKYWCIAAEMSNALKERQLSGVFLNHLTINVDFRIIIQYSFNHFRNWDHWEHFHCL